MAGGGEVTGRALGSRQFHVGPLASADCSAGIPDGDALYLVRSRFQSLRGGVNDVGFHPLPIGDAARFLKPGHRLVVAPPGRVKPEFQRPSLRCCRIDPYPPGSRSGSGGVVQSATEGVQDGENILGKFLLGAVIRVAENHDLAAVLLGHPPDEVEPEPGEPVPVGNHNTELIAAMESLQ